MTHEEKINHMFVEFERRGFKRYTCAPPGYRLLWIFGIRVAPPMFQSFLNCFAMAAAQVLTHLLLVGVIGYIFFPTVFADAAEHLGGGWALAQLLVFPLIVGLATAYSYQQKRSGMSLPRWDDYPETLIENLPRPGRKRGLEKLIEEYPASDED